MSFLSNYLKKQYKNKCTSESKKIEEDDPYRLPTIEELQKMEKVPDHPYEKRPLPLVGKPQVQILSTEYTFKHSTGFKEPLDITGEILIDGEKYKYRATEEQFAISPKVSDEILNSYNLRITLADELDRTLINDIDIHKAWVSPTSVPSFVMLGNNNVCYGGSYDYTKDKLDYLVHYDLKGGLSEEHFPRMCVFNYVGLFSREKCQEDETIFMSEEEKAIYYKAKNLKSSELYIE